MVSTLAAELIMLLVLAFASPAPPQAQKPGEAGTTRSPHGQLNVACQNCHTSIGWKPIRAFPEFDHNRTNYPLRGMHKAVTCTECHTNQVFTNVGSKCADCHADVHRRQMGAQCEQCHTVMGWQVSLQSVQQHNNRFPLMGAHATLECESCHKQAAVGQFQGLSTDCISCHSTDYMNTTAPNHRTSGFPTDCRQCHSADGWLGANFNHGAVTGFVLSGAHATLDCTACHVGGKFAGTPATCIGCHQTDFNGTTNPNHVTGGFSTDCSLCHSTVSWAGATFNHAATGFPLTGFHATLACNNCHTGGVFTQLSTACVSCHLNDFNSTTNPNHAASGFPQQCDLCHSTMAWQPSTFNHSTTVFPLTGAHTTVPCASCHINGNFTTTPTDCYSCHKTDYTGTTNPNHMAAGFPTTCATCHTTTAWTGATFNHTWFPMTHGNANGVCATCHTNPNDYSVFLCTQCHTQAQTTQQHSGVSGFVYNSVNCYACHKNGSGG